MKQISDKEYQDFQKYMQDKRNGQILTTDGLRFICEANNFDAEAIGQHFLELLPKVCPWKENIE